MDIQAEVVPTAVEAEVATEEPAATEEAAKSESKAVREIFNANRQTLTLFSLFRKVKLRRIPPPRAPTSWLSF
jgi:hypothetical protein